MKSSRAIPWAIGVTIIIVTVAFSIHFLITRTATDTGKNSLGVVKDAKDLLKEIASDIKNGMQINPRITIGRTIINEGNRDITELATKEKRFTQTYSWKHEWMGSTKIIELKGTFVGKAGYDLTGNWADPKNPWAINISDDGKVISNFLPEPEILSVEMTGYEIVDDADGHWNKISTEDRQNAVISLQKGARTELEKTEILQEADQAFLRQIEDSARKHAPAGFKVVRQQLP